MARTAIISADGHVKASRAGYREYLEKKHLKAYDALVKAEEEAELADAGNLHPDFDPAVQWDSNLRIENLESVGVIGEVLFPNGQPFQTNPFDDYPHAETPELLAAGRNAYNRWLVDFCAEAPERRRGQMQTSFLDIEQAVKDVHWAKENGLGGIVLPELTIESKSFIDPELDPIWSAIVETGLVISAHGGASLPKYGDGFAAMVSAMAENAFFSNRSLWMFISGGVFDRFPELRVSYVETQAYLLVAALDHLDAMVNPTGDWMGFAKTIEGREETTDRFASEYLGRNVFVGVSPFSPVQMGMNDLVGKDEDGYELPGVHIGADAAMFGVDYPQFESVFDGNMGQVANLVSTPGVTEQDANKILLENAAKLYDFDLAALAPDIDRVGFDLAEVSANADALKRQIPKVTKAPLMGSSLARSAASVPV